MQQHTKIKEVNNIANEVRWTKTILEEFISEGCMSEDDEKVLRMHCAGWSRVKIADNMSCSISTIDRTIARLKRKYDEVQRYDPILPPEAEIPRKTTESGRLTVFC